MDPSVIHIRSTAVQDAIAEVLSRIRRRQPRDFNRIAMRVQRIRWFRRVEAQPGDMGEVKKLRTAADAIVEEEDLPVEMLLSRALSTRAPWERIAVLAHEFGHVASTAEALQRRGGPSDEWRSELAANWYATRWGYWPEVRRALKGWDPIHHCAAPNEEVEAYGSRYWVTRNFVLRPVCPLVRPSPRRRATREK